MKALWAILCEKSIIDKDTNNASLINVIEEITLASEPPEVAEVEGTSVQGAQGPDDDSPMMRFPGELLILWARSNPEEPEIGMGRIKVIPPQGKERTSSPHTVDLTQYLRLRLRVFLPGLPLAGVGEYLIQIESRDQDEQWQVAFQLPLRLAVAATETN